jgi:hypothetical protein
MRVNVEVMRAVFTRDGFRGSPLPGNVHHTHPTGRHIASSGRRLQPA